MKQAARITHDDDETATSAKLGELLSGLATEDRDELRTMAAALANLIGVATTPEGTYSAEEIGQAELHWGIRRVLELVAARRPLVLVLEDLHWAEPTLIELVATVLEGGEGSPMLLLCSARPEASETWPAFFADGENRRTVELEALGAGASEALLAELLREKGLPPEVAARVLENAGGNPLFIEETVSMLERRGRARRRRRRVAPRADQSPGANRIAPRPAGSQRQERRATGVRHRDGFLAGRSRPPRRQRRPRSRPLASSSVATWFVRTEARPWPVRTSTPSSTS